MKKPQKKLFALLTATVMSVIFSTTAFAEVRSTNVGITVSENANGTLKATPTVSLVNKGEEASAGTTIFAAYKDDTLCDAVFASNEALAPKSGDKTTPTAMTVPVLDNLPVDIDCIKVFTWDSLTNVKPLEPRVVTYNVNKGFPKVDAAPTWGGTSVEDATRGSVLKTTFKKNFSYVSSGDFAGTSCSSDFQMNIKDYLLMHGQGTYVLDCWVKPSVAGRALDFAIQGHKVSHLTSPADRGAAGRLTLIESTTTEWTHIRKVFDVVHYAGGYNFYDRVTGNTNTNAAFLMTDDNGNINCPSSTNTAELLIDDFKFYKETVSTVAQDNNKWNETTKKCSFENATAVGENAYPGIFTKKSGTSKIVDSDAHSGKYALEFTGGQLQHYMYNDATGYKNLSADKKYELSFWVKRVVDANPADYYALYLTSGSVLKLGDGNVTNLASRVVGTDWVKITVPCSVKAIPTRAKDAWYLYVGANKTYLFDDFELTEVAE